MTTTPKVLAAAVDLATARLIFASYVEDRAHGWDESSGIHSALLEVAKLIRDGEAEASFAAGELDDIIAARRLP